MSSRTIRLDADVYERLEAFKRTDETFSEAVERLLSGGSLLDIVGLCSAEETEAVRETLDEVDADATSDVEDLLGRIETE